jgi:replicative DNA helicase Mcm
MEKKAKQEELIIEAKNFFNFYKKKIGESIKEGKSVVLVGFKDLESFSHELAEELAVNPEETLGLLEMALEDLGLISNPRIRLVECPEGYSVKVRNIRAKHLNKLIVIEGIVRQASDVRPQVVNAKFECPSCGTIISILQIEKKFREPSRCSCGRKSGFNLISKDMVDAQRIVIEESPESLTGGEQPRRMNVFLKEDLVDPKMEERTTPGSRVMVIGILKEVPIPLQTGALSTRFDLAVEANNVIPLEETFDELKISEEDERQIQELAADPGIFHRLNESVAPSIYGHNEIKQSLILQLFGGVKKKKSDGNAIRGDIHILLVGDPGVAKSQLLKFMSGIAPKGRYIVGKSASGAGMTATVVRDEYLKGWSLEAGAMVLANKGLVCLLPGSNIILDNKIMPIENVFDAKNKKIVLSNNERVEICDIDYKVPALLGDSLEFGSVNASMIRRKMYNGKILRINMDSGFSIALTPNHKLVDGNSLLWKEAEKFKKGDFLLAPLKLPEKKEDVFIFDIIPDNWIVCLDNIEKIELKKKILREYKNLEEFNSKYCIDKDYLSGGKQLQAGVLKKILNEFGIYEIWKNKNLKYGRKKSGESLKIPIISPELAYFIGFVYGDGHVLINNKHSNIQINQSLRNIKQIDSIKKMFGSFSNNKLSEYRRIMKSIIRGQETASDNLSLSYGSNLIAYLYDFFTKNSLSNVLQMNNECIKAFVAGAMDSDGCISIKNSLKNGKKYQMVDAEFLLSNSYTECKNFILALRRLDCYAKIIPGKGVSKIIITGRNDIITLLKAIENYSVKTKELPMKKINVSSSSDKLPKDIISEICGRVIEKYEDKRELNELGISSTIYSYKNKVRQPSRGQLKKILELGAIPENLKYKTEILLRRDFFIDKITEVEEEDYFGYVYDLFVPDKHNFICEGLVVHNCIDEFEKMDTEDRSAMHESLEQQTVTISKANIQATLRAETSVLSAANPKFGRFDPYQPIASQIDIPPTLLNRFDVIFTLRDIPDRGKDEAIASHVLAEHQKQSVKNVIEPLLLRKYVAYAKQNIHPVLSDDAIDEIKRFYVELRNAPVASDAMMKPIPISARQLEALIRLSEAGAKLRLSKIVSREDAIKAIDLMKYYLMQVGYDYESKTFDIDKIVTGVPTSQRNRIVTVREVLAKLESKMGKLIPREEIDKELEGKISIKDIDEVLDKLTISGDIFHPRKGYVQRTSS